MIDNPDGSEVDLSTDPNARAREPIEISQEVARVLRRLPADSPVRPVFDAMLTGHQRNQHRRASVLRHEDLRKQLTEPPVGYRRAEDWNGYVPPRLYPADESELLRNITATRGGEMVVRLNQNGNRTCGPQFNDSPRRAALVEISAEAKRRETAA